MAGLLAIESSTSPSIFIITVTMVLMFVLILLFKLFLLRLGVSCLRFRSQDSVMWTRRQVSHLRILYARF